MVDEAPVITDDPLSWLVVADWLEENAGLYDEDAHETPERWRLRAEIARRIGLQPQLGAFQGPTEQGWVPLDNGWTISLRRAEKSYTIYARKGSGKAAKKTTRRLWSYAEADKDPGYLKKRLWELADEIDDLEHNRSRGFVTFLDGPGKGQGLNLKRAPLFLRLVVKPDGRIDALDQLEDRPADEERLYAYRLQG